MILRLKHDTPRSILFKHNFSLGLIIFAVGLGISYFAHLQKNDNDVWVAWVVASIFLVCGLVVFLGRAELELLPLNGRYRYKRGMLFTLREVAGPLSDIQSITIRKHLRSSSNSKGARTRYYVWLLELLILPMKKPITIVTDSDEVRCRQLFEHFAKKLRLRAVDETGDEGPIEKSWTELDQKIASDRSFLDKVESVDFNSPPGGLNVELAAAGFRITIPKIGFNFITVFLMVFGAAFGGMGLFAALTFSGVITDKSSGDPMFGVTVGLGFFFFGMFIVLLGFFFANTRARIAVYRNSLVTDRVFGRIEFASYSINLGEIEELSVRKSTRSIPVEGKSIGGLKLIKYIKPAPQKSELLIRTDSRSIIFTSNNEDHLHWIRRAILTFL